jgi:hypothetical protein
MTSQQYLAASAYRAFFHGQCGMWGARELAKAAAPPRCKLFMWLTLLDWCWTMDRHHRHNLQDDDSCALCGQLAETLDHLLLSCIFSRELWFKLLHSVG